MMARIGEAIFQISADTIKARQALRESGERAERTRSEIRSINRQIELDVLVERIFRHEIHTARLRINNYIDHEHIVALIMLDRDYRRRVRKYRDG